MRKFAVQMRQGRAMDLVGAQSWAIVKADISVGGEGRTRICNEPHGVSHICGHPGRGGNAMRRRQSADRKISRTELPQMAIKVSAYERGIDAFFKYGLASDWVHFRLEICPQAAERRTWRRAHMFDVNDRQSLIAPNLKQALGVFFGMGVIPLPPNRVFKPDLNVDED